MLGTISFLVWSAFSTWYYVNYIKDSDDRQDTVVGAETGPDEVPVLSEEEVGNSSPEENSSALADVSLTDPEPDVPALSSIDLDRNFIFYKNSVDLTKPRLLDNFLDSLGPLLTDRKAAIQIVGHTCDLGKSEYNLLLGQRRADFAMKKFTSLELEDIRITSESAGEDRPLFPNDSEDSRVKNRRVSIKIKSLP